MPCTLYILVLTTYLQIFWCYTSLKSITNISCLKYSAFPPVEIHNKQIIANNSVPVNYETFSKRQSHEIFVEPILSKKTKGVQYHDI